MECYVANIMKDTKVLPGCEGTDATERNKLERVSKCTLFQCFISNILHC